MTQQQQASVDFTELYQRGFSALVAQVYAYLGDGAEAQDLVQEAYLRAWQKWRIVSQYDDPVAWVRRVAFNLATSRWRRQNLLNRVLRQHHTAHRVPVPAIGPEHVALVSALRQLPQQQRLAVVLHYLADMSVEDVAIEIGVPRGTVLSWLHRSREKLAAQLSGPETPP